MIGDKIGTDATAEGGHVNHIAAGVILLFPAFFPYAAPFLLDQINGMGGFPPELLMYYVPHTLLFGGLGVWRLMKGFNPPEKSPKIYAVYDTKASFFSTLFSLFLFGGGLSFLAFTTAISMGNPYAMEMPSIVPVAMELGLLAFFWFTYSNAEFDGEKQEVRLPGLWGNSFPFDQVDGVGEVQLKRAGSGFTIGWQLGVLLKGEPKARQIFGGSAEQIRTAAAAICAKTGLLHLRNPDMHLNASLLNTYGAGLGSSGLGSSGLGSSGLGSSGSSDISPELRAALAGLGSATPAAAATPAGAAATAAPPKPKEQVPLSDEEVASIETLFVQKMQLSQKEMLRGFTMHNKRPEVIATLRALGEKGTGKALKRLKKELRDYVMVPQYLDNEVEKETLGALDTLQARLDREQAAKEAAKAEGGGEA